MTIRQDGACHILVIPSLVASDHQLSTAFAELTQSTGNLRDPGVASVRRDQMHVSRYREHKTEAVRLRSSAANATTSALKARLLAEAEKYEQLARGEPTMPPGRHRRGPPDKSRG